MPPLKPLRVVGNYVVRTPDGGVATDVAALLEDVLLFDHVVVDSSRLIEFRELVAKFDSGAVTDLLKSGCLSVHCDALCVATNGSHHLPPRLGVDFPCNAFSVAVVGLPSCDHPGYVRDAMAELVPDPTLRGKRYIKLKGAIADRLTYVSRDRYAGILGIETARDLVGKPDLVALAVSGMLARSRGLELSPSAMRIELTELEPTVFSAKSNLAELGVAPPIAAEAIRGAALAIGTRNYRIAGMELLDAVAGFQDDDLPLFENKLAFLECDLSPDNRRAALRHVVEVGGLPSFGALIDARQLRMDRLIEVRNDPACREFRDWLAGSGGVPDEVIRQMCSSVRAKLGSFASSMVGRAIRFVAKKAPGSIDGYGPIATKLADGADQMLMKLLSTSGPITFLSAKYPSLYEPSSF